MPRKTTPKQPPKKQAPSGAFIDAKLMRRAIVLYAEGKTMKAIGEELNVKATGCLAKKIRDTYDPDALARPAKG